jgi:hypothetical protein
MARNNISSYAFASVAFLFLFPTLGFSQNDWCLKAQAYKKRFYEKFIFVPKDISIHAFGDQFPNPWPVSRTYMNGMGIPFSEIHMMDCPSNDGSNGNCKLNNIKMGDATSFLGFYIAYLATEYEVKRRLGHDTNFELEQLFTAMKSFERLDAYAEMFYVQDDQHTILNGFFMRDDLCARQADIDYRKSNSLFYKGDNLQSSFIASDFKNDDYVQGNAVEDKIMSKQLYSDGISGAFSIDQITYLCMGFALVQKFLPDESIQLTQTSPTTLIPQSTEITFNFHMAAKSYIYRMIKYLQDHNYTLVYPTNNNPTVPNYQGQFNSYGLALVGNWSKGQLRFFNNTTTYFNYSVWQSLRCSEHSAYSTNKFNRSLNATTCAIGNSWDYMMFQCNPANTPWWVWLGIGIYSITTGIHQSHCATWTTCAKRGRDHVDGIAFHFNLPLYALLYRVLHGDPARLVGLTETLTKNLLCSAPWAGPSRDEVVSYVPGTNPLQVTTVSAPVPWNTPNLHQYSYEAVPRCWRDNSPNCNPGRSSGAFNGLDYLLLYNLYALYPAKANGTGVGINREVYDNLKGHLMYLPSFPTAQLSNIQVNLPTSQQVIPPSDFWYSKGIYAYGTLSISNTSFNLNDTKPVDIISESEVILGDNFTIQTGSTVSISNTSVPNAPSCSLRPNQTYKNNDFNPTLFVDEDSVFSQRYINELIDLANELDPGVQDAYVAEQIALSADSLTEYVEPDRKSESINPLFSIYPNPTKDNVIVIGLIDNSFISIYNEYGSIVYSCSGNEFGISINLRNLNLSPGTYVFKVSTNTQKIYRKIIYHPD